jgi:hypothetical protein
MLRQSDEPSVAYMSATSWEIGFDVKHTQKCLGVHISNYKGTMRFEEVILESSHIEGFFKGP